MLRIDSSELRDFHSSSQLEWLETNGLGGWCSSSLNGCNTRRYHGLLMAATRPPADRMLLVSKLEETLVLEPEAVPGGKEIRTELGTNLYRDDTIHPKGYAYLESFTRGLFPEWIYAVKGIRLKKTIGMQQGKNRSLLRYEVLEAPGPFTLELRPFIAARGYHELQHTIPASPADYAVAPGKLKIKLIEHAPTIYIHVPGSDYLHRPDWYLCYHHAAEKERGLDFEEDLYTPGFFRLTLKQGDQLGILLSTDAAEGEDALALLATAEKRKASLLQKEPGDALLRQLLLAADQFIVKRELLNHNGQAVEGRTIIAGYHWFTDWGRDTMIALPGLTLSAGRLDDARMILAAFAQSVSQGMLPNRFTENDPPEYNNADGTLWYFLAVHAYLEAGGDPSFILEEILPVLKEIVDWHFRGTRYGIHADADGLLFAGEPGQQLTWMDARIGDWVVTPRMGKPVEIQALWFNCLKIFAAILRMNQQDRDAELVEYSAGRIREKFEELFWYAEGSYLFDVIDENGKADISLRPNQLLAISLPYPLLGTEKASKVLSIVREKLYTPFGLRSLSADDPRYIPHYGGDAWHRDSAYHQGTVWSWLLGPYIDALVTIDNDKKAAREVITAFAPHLLEGCIGTVSEIFDASAPHAPKGCVAQAWSVGELLRVIKKYELYDDYLPQT